MEQLRVLVCAGSVQLLTCMPAQLKLFSLSLTLGLLLQGGQVLLSLEASCLKGALPSHLASQRCCR